ncbi:MAG: AAA family ATPase [Bacteroidales bacterium]|nr:AAA family ATPase [Bacteroidales bacterium]
MNGKQYINDIEELVGISLKPQERIQLLRRILDMLFKDLTKKYEIVMTTLQPRMACYCQQENIDKQTTQLLHELRIFCNKVVHNEIINPTENNEKYCVKILSEFISQSCNVEISEKIKAFYIKENSFNPLLIRTTKKYEEVSEIHGFIKNINKTIKQDRFGKDFIDILVENDDFGTISIRLTKTDKDDIITELANIAWEYAEIVITDIIFDKENGYYYSTTKTLVILEPSFIIDVKQIAECNEFIGAGRWNIDPGSYQRKKFEETKTNESITKGYLIGSILDEIASNTQFNFNDKADDFFKTSVISTLSLRKEKENEVTERIKIEVQPQETNIRNSIQKFNNHKVSIEPTFLSVKYGIQGRIDALYEKNSNTNDKTVIELKSGNYRYSNPQHQAQTALYDLLLKSTYPSRFGNSFILYSQKPNDSLTLVNADEATVTRIQRKAMLIRNKIVSDEFKIAKGEMNPINEAIGSLELKPIERMYFDGYCQFICNELKTAKEKHISTLLSNGGDNSSSKYLTNLTIIDISDDFQIKLNINPDGELLFDLPDFKENDYIMLFPVDADGTTNPLKHQILKSIIKEIDDEQITVSLINKQLNKDYLKQYKRWTICQDFRESTIKYLYQQVYSLVTASEEKKQLILTLEKKPTFSEVNYINNPRLSKLQNQIVKQAVSSDNYYIIQGPPGTGKTRYILTGIVDYLNKTEKVVVIAHTNQAVTEICSIMHELNIDFIRLGGRSDNPFSINKISEELTLTKLLDKIEKTNVIVSTQHTLFSNLELINTIKYKTIIVDEASQLLEPQLIGIITKFDRFILIGDEKQLPAITLQEDTFEKINDELKSISLLKYNESLFYRLLLNAKLKKWDCYSFLKEQGRMHIDIAEFPNKQYYQNQLQIISEDQKNEGKIFSSDSHNYIERCLALKRVIFIPSDKDKISFKNDSEQKLIHEFLKVILQICKTKNIDIVSKSRSNNELSIGVITPFRKQITNIKRIIPHNLKDIILVDSIEKFQGSERDIIFYSTAINNKKQIDKLQSLVNIDNSEVDRKLNVALTRAKKHLIITGTKFILEKDEHYKQLIKHIELNGGLIQINF